MKKSIIKNGRIHFEGQKNERIATCLHCDSKIKRNEGYKIIGYGTFNYVHKDCKVDYFKDFYKSEKEYSHGIVWNIKITCNRGKLQGLQSMGWMLSKDSATISINTLNRFKSLQGLEGLSAVVEILLPNTEEIKKLVFPNIGYDKLRSKVIKETKKYKYFTLHGIEKSFDDYPNFDI